MYIYNIYICTYICFDRMTVQLIWLKTAEHNKKTHEAREGEIEKKKRNGEQTTNGYKQFSGRLCSKNKYNCHTHTHTQMM